MQQETPPPPPPKEEPKPEPVKAEPAKPATPSKFGYTWAQFDIVRGDGDFYLRGPDGFDIHGSYALPPAGLFVFGGVEHLSGNTGGTSPDTNTLTLGFGIHTAINPMTDFVADVALKHANSEQPTPAWAPDGAGYGVGIGVRHMAHEALEVNGGIQFSDYDDSDSETTLHFGLVYKASQTIGLCTNVTTNDDLDTLTLGVRFTP